MYTYKSRIGGILCIPFLVPPTLLESRTIAVTLFTLSLLTEEMQEDFKNHHFLDYVFDIVEDFIQLRK
ncbi:MAG TPA: hypothetical protein VEH06_13920 [Candidatus Bathyarchaeia archaeon]|nr:hypothetical protein [Candidatus Bathyarchaeia archaeon]